MRKYKGKPVDLDELAHHIVDGWDYGDLLRCAVDGTVHFLASLDEDDLAEQVELSGYDDILDDEED